MVFERLPHNTNSSIVCYCLYCAIRELFTLEHAEPCMERNVGSTDKTARILLGALAGVVSLGILSNAISLPAILAPVLGLASVILLATGFTGFCGLYGLLGVDTCSVDT